MEITQAADRFLKMTENNVKRGQDELEKEKKARKKRKWQEEEHFDIEKLRELEAGDEAF